MMRVYEKSDGAGSNEPSKIFGTNELQRGSVVAKNATVQQEGNRVVVRQVDDYNRMLDVLRHGLGKSTTILVFDSLPERVLICGSITVARVNSIMGDICCA